MANSKLAVKGGRHSPFVNSRCDNTTFSQSCEGFSSSQRLSATRVPHGAWLVSWTLALAAAAGSTGSWVHAVQRARGLSGGGPGCGAAASKGQDLTRSPRKHLTLAHSATQQFETTNGEPRPRETLFDRCVCVRVIDLSIKKHKTLKYRGMWHTLSVRTITINNKLQIISLTSITIYP